MLKVALTGGIASGKSTVCNYFANLGVPIIDADLVAKSLLVKNEIGYITALELFGTEILNKETNEINFQIFRDVFFSNPALKKRYEEIIHPIVFTEIYNFQKNSTHTYTIACIPLLFEKKQQANFDTTILLVSETTTRLTRTLNRDKVETQQARNIIESQISAEDAIKLADHIIYNNSDLDYLHQRVNQLHNILTNSSHP